MLVILNAKMMVQLEMPKTRKTILNCESKQVSLIATISAYRYVCIPAR